MSKCGRCHGKEVRTYPSTAIWMGGIGGQALTEGVCDLCWGSGDENNPGENLRVRLAIERAATPLDPKAAARTLREISVLASHGIDVSDLLNYLADQLENA